jgi:hypothetical protein
MTPIYRVEVFWRGQADGRSADMLSQISHLDEPPNVSAVRVSDLFFLRGALAPTALERIATELLADPVVEAYRWQQLGPPAGQAPPVTLTRNASNRFECRWVWLEPNPESPCIFTAGLRERVHCPAAHGEGRFVPRDDAVLAQLVSEQLIAVTHTTADGGEPGYPGDPNGSIADVAGICNAQGNVFGLMPHPEDQIAPQQHPRYHRGERGNLGLVLFGQGMRYAAPV